MGLWMQACCLPVEAPCVYDKGAHHGYTDSPGQIFLHSRTVLVSDRAGKKLWAPPEPA